MIVTQSEYEKIVDLLGREPGPTELGVVEAMWSEHRSTVDGATAVELKQRAARADPTASRANGKSYPLEQEFLLKPGTIPADVSQAHGRCASPAPAPVGDCRDLR